MSERDTNRWMLNFSNVLRVTRRARRRVLNPGVHTATRISLRIRILAHNKYYTYTQYPCILWYPGSARSAATWRTDVVARVFFFFFNFFIPEKYAVPACLPTQNAGPAEVRDTKWYWIGSTGTTAICLALHRVDDISAVYLFSLQERRVHSRRVHGSRMLNTV